MARVEIMTFNDPTILQAGINDFIKDKKVIDIKYQSIAVPATMTGSDVDSYDFYDRCLIIYEEDNTDE